MSLSKVRNVVVIGDTHCGSSIALMPPRFKNREGQIINQSPQQKILWKWWKEFWEFAEEICAGDPFIVVHNGDMIDGSHHGTTQLGTNNVSKQREMFVDMMKPRLENAEAFYCTCGTMAHAGQSSADEESCARQLNAVKDSNGNHVRQDLWIEMGADLIQFAHHIGVTSSQAYKSSPAMRLMASMYGAAGEWGFRPPTIMIRSHAHDYVEVKRPNCRVVVCPAWQLKSDWVWGKDTASLPIIGGLVLRQGEQGKVFIRDFVRTMKPSQPIKL